MRYANLFWVFCCRHFWTISLGAFSRLKIRPVHQNGVGGILSRKSHCFKSSNVICSTSARFLEKIYDWMRRRLSTENSSTVMPLMGWYYACGRFSDDRCVITDISLLNINANCSEFWSSFFKSFRWAFWLN